MKRFALFAVVCGLLTSASNADPAPGRLDILERADVTQIEPSRLTDVAWIAGQWIGEALGGTVEEIWSQPAGGSMMGVFRLIKDGKIVFYEIMTLVEDAQGVAMRLKHFDAALEGWEERREVVEFRLLRVSGERFYFDGVTFVRGRDAMGVELRIRNKDRGSRDESFRYRRVTPITAEP